MLKKLLALDEQLLSLIASEYSIFGRHEEVARKMKDYLDAYGLKWADFTARYGLEE